MLDPFSCPEIVHSLLFNRIAMLEVRIHSVRNLVLSPSLQSMAFNSSLIASFSPFTLEITIIII
jgi:hypothetical protein